MTVKGQPAPAAPASGEAEGAARRSLWPLWQVVPLAVVLAAPFGIGAYYGLRAVRLGEGKGWIGLGLHLVVMLVALVMPITEALT